MVYYYVVDIFDWTGSPVPTVYGAAYGGVTNPKSIIKYLGRCALNDNFRLGII